MFKTLKEMIQDEDFFVFIESKLGNDLFINDPDRAVRRQEAAEFGTIGDLNCEIIEDWREFLQVAFFVGTVDEPLWESISNEIDEVESWHDNNGSLYEPSGG